MNQVTIMGRFVACPTISATKTGKQFCKFTLAVKRPHNSEVVDYIDMLAWENTGIFIANHFKKGQKVAICGYLIVCPWTDQDGKKRKSYEVIVQDVYFAGSVVKVSDGDAPVSDNKDSEIAADEPEEPYQCTDDDLFDYF